MSNNDSIDEETKRILAEVDSDDSKESKPIQKDKKVNQNDEYNEYEVSDKDPLQDKDMDDREW